MSIRKKSTGPAVDATELCHSLVKDMMAHHKALHPFLASLDFINMSDDMINDIFVSKRARDRQLKVLVSPHDTVGALSTKSKTGLTRWGEKENQN